MTHTWEVAAPKGQLRLAVSLDEAGVVRYGVVRGDETLVAPSAIGIDIRPGGLLGTGLEVRAAEQRRRDETYAILAGKASHGQDLCQELHLELCESHGARRRVDLDFRVYEDGIAFRYVIPRQAGMDTVEVVAERSEFRFCADHRCWAMDLPHFESPFENEFTPRRLGDLRTGQLISCPLAIQTESGVAMAITEAGLTGYAGMYVEALAGDRTALLTRLAPRMDGTYASVRGGTPMSSPWRVIQVAESAVKLIESSILYSLNAPCALADTTWIKAGKVTWDWWCGHAPSGGVQKPGMNNETMMDFIDFAAEMRLEYMLVDGGWYMPGDVLQSKPEIDLRALVTYANGKGVDLMVWNHQRDLKPKLAEAFAYYASLNIKGVKVDFFDRDDQETVAYAQRVIEVAAENRLLLDLHGIYKPTGLERTHPNLMTQEGIMGAEYNKWSARITPEHNVTIPFTRMLAGPMDYTPGAFGNVTAEQFRPRHIAPMVMGTRCHNLAMYVVYQSALQMVSDYPDAIRGRRGAEFLTVVPAAWDETVGVAGAVGEYIVLARRKGTQWFLGVMGNSQPRSVEIPLGFLGAGAYAATLYVDGPDAASDPTSLLVRERRVGAGETLTAELAPGGGMAGWLRAIA